MKTPMIVLSLLFTCMGSACLGQDFAKIRNLELPGGKALVYVYSKDKKNVPIYCDGQVIGWVQKNKFVYSILDSGRHTFSYPRQSAALDVTVEPSRAYYIVQTQKDAPLALVADAGEAERDLASYKLSRTVSTSFADAPDGSDNYRQGFIDAESRYTKTGGAAIGNALATGLTSPLVGLIPAFITAGATPADRNLNVADPEKLADAEYMKGYREGARKKKKKAVWSGYATGVSLWSLLLLILL